MEKGYCRYERFGVFVPMEFHSMYEILIFCDDFCRRGLPGYKDPSYDRVKTRPLTLHDEWKQSIDKGPCFY